MTKPAKNNTPKVKSNHEIKQVKHEFWGIVFLFLGLFSLISLISYQHTDPSLFSKTNQLPTNYGGKIGANVAEVLIQLGGSAGFLFSFLCFSFCIRLFQGQGIYQLAGNILWIVLAFFSTSSLLSLQMDRFSYGGATFPAGGIIGGFSASILKQYLNTPGATLFTFSVLFISLIYATPFSASKFFLLLIRLSLMGVWAIVKFISKAFELIKSVPVVHQKIVERKIEKVFENQSASTKIAQPEIITSAVLSQPKKKTIPDEHLSDADFEVDFDELDQPTENKKPLKVIERKKEPKKLNTKESHAKAKDDYSLPPIDFLTEPVPIENAIDRNRLQENSKTLEQKLISFGIDGRVVAVRPGPVITMYEFKPGLGVKVSQIQNRADDLSLALSAKSCRILAPIPGRDVVGIEIPNQDREAVYLREILSTEEFNSTQANIPLCIGKDISGAPVVSDLAKMPHLLIAGAPGAGKSVFVNSLLCSLLYKFTPNEMRLILVDPKQLELNLYENIPHLLLPVVDDPKKASTALKWAVKEMDRRYKLMARAGTRNVSMFNDKLKREGEEKLAKILCPEDEQGMPLPNSLSAFLLHNEKGKPRIETFPYILVIIDEFADLIMVAKNEVEQSVMRIAQKARAAGIHLVIATQRPSTDVVTGLLKSNLPTRISFKVPTKQDSRVILDTNGAEQLLGQGDMLFIPPGSPISRIHGAFVNEDEIGKICEHWKTQGTPIFQEDILVEEDEFNDEIPDGAGDELYQDAISFVRETGHASSSMLQRRFKLGYNRAARMIDAMEAQGIVGPGVGSKPREVIY